MLLAAAFNYGNDHILGLLEDTHNVYFEDDQMFIAMFYELAPEVRQQLLNHLSDIVKIGIINLSEDSSLTPRISQLLENGGISIEVFDRQKDLG